MSKPFSVNKSVYAMAMVDNNTAEITMYGNVVEKRPVDWWTGKELDGDFIVLDEFLDDLEKISKCKAVTIRMNSYGGDCVCGMVIHNRLRELARAGTKLTCVVDGVAMSAASVIMAACDTVRVNPASLVMIHRCWSFLYGGYNADELRSQAEAQDKYDIALAASYVRKTGLSEDEIMKMMSETVYFTGKEAVEKGFADELIEDAEPLNLAASADGQTLFVRGKEMHLCPGMFAPDTIPTVADPNTVTPEDTSVEANTNQPENPGSNEGGTPMTLEELREQHPELVAQIEASAAATAVQAEQQRLQAIDEVAQLFSDDLVRAAKYGNDSCTAEKLSHRAAVAAAKQGQHFLSATEADATISGANAVPPASEPIDGGEEDIAAKAKAAAASYLKMKEGK